MSRKKQRPSPAPDNSSPDGSNTISEQTYSVGFGRPPRHSQFQPGQSGNPKGRAKQSRNLKTIVKQVLDEKIQIREGGRLRNMPRIEAIVRNTASGTFKNDARALSALMALIKQSGYGDEPNDPHTDLLLGQDYQVIIDDFLERYSPKGGDAEIAEEQASSNKEGSS